MPRPDGAAWGAAQQDLYRFGESYLIWDGDGLEARAKAAAIQAIDECNAMAAERAREDHPWENQTGQTEESVFGPPERGNATIKPDGQVWGYWGVNAHIRLRPSGEPYRQGTTTEDVAMFLEFGTVRMEARPWIYPAYDWAKVQLPGLFEAAYKGMGRMVNVRGYSYTRGGRVIRVGPHVRHWSGGG